MVSAKPSSWQSSSVWRRKKRSLLLWVLDTNATGRGFYEALGGVPVGEKTEELGGATIREVAYGWPDLTELLTRTRPNMILRPLPVKTREEMAQSAAREARGVIQAAAFNWSPRPC
ncbi:MAG: hypothetical protein U0232_12255 [Thermomicrobiales bacterium]